MFSSPWALPVGIALLALLMRLSGIGWALPTENRLFSFHPDESVVVSRSLAVNPLTFQLDPQFYNYGSLGLLVNGLFIHLGEMTGLVRESPAPGIPSASALLMARLVTVGLGVGTCLFLFAIGRLLYSRTAGAVAAALYAIAPLAVQHGHFATVDVPATFWLTGALYFAVRHLSDERKAQDLLWCGVWAGLAAATKYNAGLALLSGIVAWAQIKPRPISGIALLIGGAAAGFLLGCPGLLLNFEQFWTDFQYEANHVRQGHGDTFVNTSPGFLYQIYFNLGWGLGAPLLIVALTGLVFALIRRRPGDLALLAFFVPYYLLIGNPAIQIKFARYAIPLLPPLLLWAGALIPEWKTGKIGERIATVGIAAAAVFALLVSLAFNNAMTGTDPRDEAAVYLKQQGLSPVGFATGPWFYSPTLGPLLTHYIPPIAQKSALDIETPRLIPAIWEGKPVEWSVPLLRASQPQAVPLSELNEYADAVRIEKPEAMEYINTLQANYPTKKVFAAPLTVLGLPISRLTEVNGLPVQNLPHDMLYTNPTVVVFETAEPEPVP
ncbi:MAG: hypothetical protein OHK0029_01910 [Armatimonadaceae bacterium]